MSKVSDSSSPLKLKVSFLLSLLWSLVFDLDDVLLRDASLYVDIFVNSSKLEYFY